MWMKTLWRTVKPLTGCVAASILVLGVLSGSAAAETELIVYTTIEADELPEYKTEFEKEYPDIEIKWVRDSTGIITAKLLAEKDNPQADVAWGIDASSLLLLATVDYFQPYAPKGLDKLDPALYDTKNDPPIWLGQRAYISSICFNTSEAEKYNLPAPTSWEDLTKPVYKGHVVMPNPNSSGTGYLNVSSWIQMSGEDEAWRFMDALHENIAWYTHSGSKPCRQAGAGEVPIGISFAFRGADLKRKGAPLEVIAPAEGIGWDVESLAIVKGTDKLDAAKKLVDWSMGRTANEIYARDYAVVVMKGMSKPVEYFPEGIVDRMIENDFEWAGAQRLRILKNWSERYDSKSLPKE